MAVTLEDKFVVFEYDSSRVHPGPALILFQVKNSKFVKAYVPRDHSIDLDIYQCEVVRDYLLEHKVREVYSPNKIVPMPKSIFGLDLNFDNDWEWGSYRPLGRFFFRSRN